MERRDEHKLTRISIVSALWFCILVPSTRAVDTISANQTIRDGETIVSAQETFELGFFSPGNSSHRYIGIWYKKISTGTVVWVANRESPLTDKSGMLTLTLQGILLLQNATGGLVWSSANSTGSPARDPVGRIMENGNFIVRERSETDPDNYIWQSFDYPTDTFLSGMKFGRDFVTGIERHFVSWTSDTDPSPGQFSAWIDTHGYPQLVLRRGPSIMFRAGPWNGLRFSGGANLRPNPFYKFEFVLNPREWYYHFDLINASVITRVVVNSGGGLERLLWIERTQKWIVYLTLQTDNCDRYALCGAYGSCDINASPACGCLKGFQPTSQAQWTVSDWSQGCRRITALDCRSDEGFRKYSGLKLPDTQWSWFNQSMNLDECERWCKSNCSCTAYTSSNITGKGSGCLLWFGALMDVRTYTENGQDLYIRMPASELAKDGSSGVKRRVQIIAPIVSALLVILAGLCLFYRYKSRKTEREGISGKSFREDDTTESDKEDFDLPQFSLSTLLKATNNFSIHNKVGEGGFGPVYKGLLEGGQEIAVKRLSLTSTQGLDEFKSEVITIAKLQHRNLVKLLGCCIRKEKMLVYEYMPNKGLDSFIFDETKSKVLDWPKRFHIINGIARGLLYLHQDSRLRIIHRDLKASNILLDSDMNPKISDFGMARSFGGNETEANTNRVVGTYGYMAPEYAGDGIFSVKSDVFSFGVLVLEIVSGKKNRGFFHQDHSNNLLGHAWSLHKEGKPLKLVHSFLSESGNLSEVLRSIHVGLLCVQQRPDDRPSMSSVVLMLSGEGALPPPKQPGFFTEKNTSESGYSSSTYGISSTNELTITMLIAR